MVAVEGLSAGSRTHRVRSQSTYSVALADAQNARSASSVLKDGIAARSAFCERVGFRRAFRGDSLVALK